MSSARRDPRNARTTQSDDPRADPTLVPAAPEPRDGPTRSDEETDLAQLIESLLDDIAPLVTCSDPLDAEMAGAALLSMAPEAGDGGRTAFVQGFIPEIEAASSDSGLALLLAISSVAAGGEEQVAEAASAAAGRLVAAGVPEPRWARELATPPLVGDCIRIHDADETMSILAVSFQRGEYGHTFLIIVDERNCGAAADIVCLDAGQFSGALEDIYASAAADGVQITTQTLDPAEWCWYAESAMDSRAVHDEEWLTDGDWDDEDGDGDDEVEDDEVEDRDDEGDGEGDDEGEDDGGAPYPVLVRVLRARLSVLPEPRQPAGAPDRDAAAGRATTVLEALASVMGETGGLPFGGPGAVPFGRPLPAELPAKRKKSAGPAPIYQIKIGLRGAKPPIWRRLLVPANVSLAELHDIIQAAFAWDDSHMHVFETPYGEFGMADRELGHRAEGPVALEQVASRVKDKIRYTYDFGDNWSHDIEVEKVLDRDPALTYPRCTGGRRAAPPDDCGGIWGYAEMTEVLADPQHPEHNERLEWLGLNDVGQFDPAAFDVAEVNHALATLR